MTLRIITALILAVLCLSSCSDYVETQPAPGQEEHTYSFTAVLPGADTRLSYQETPGNRNLKMTWDEGDVIRLYPDPSMNDTEPYYDFIANTGAGTSHTVFVHQGYIYNWEHWSGKAIYLFPDGDNIDVSHDSAEFLAKAYAQKSNGNTEHLKYAEHVAGPDGSKQYTEYWSDHLVDANLKHDHKMTFSHPHTVVYKVMLRGFIFDIPGGSQLKMSGDAWGGEETVLTLGSEDDEQPFLKVGEYGKENYEDNVLTAYIIRQVAGDVDGEIKKGENLRFELLCYDKLDGTVMELDPEDTMRNGNPDYGKDYFTNIPWGDEYTWEVSATDNIEYKSGDFIVADLTDKIKDYAYPKVAVDMGLPIKWAAFNVGAKKIDEPGGYVVWGHTTVHSEGGSSLFDILNEDWTSGDAGHDAATFHWGNEWRTPTFNEFLDLVHYAMWLDSADSEPSSKPAMWKSESELIKDDAIYNFRVNPARDINNVKVALVKSKVNDRYIYIHISGNVQGSGTGVKAIDKAYYNTSTSKGGYPMFMSIIKYPRSDTYYVGYTNNMAGTQPVNKLGVSLKAVKD